ncbi:MAG: ABC transporter permease, partial [Alphaproteobacteria bacterium]
LSVLALRGLAGLLMRLARAAGRPPISELRIALANLYRPGAPTGGVVLALGLGLTLLVTVVLIDGNFARQLDEQIPDRAPSFFFVDIQYDPSGTRDQTEEFDELVTGIDGVISSERVPSVRGRIVRIKGVPSDEAEVEPGGRWAVRGDTSISYSGPLPPNSTVVAGEWWGEDYSGPPLLSMDADLADAFGVSVGDTITINIMGRNFETRLASTRERAESTVGIYYWFVLSPGLLETVPHMHVAAVRVKDAAEEKLYRAVTDAFPNVTAVRVKEVLETLNARLESLGLAVRGASGVTILAGIFVLAGAMAAGHRQRVYDAVMFKVLGATRGRILTAYLLEYAILGLATALLAAGAGTLAAWVVITQVMEAPWLFLPEPAFVTAGVAAAITVLMGLIGTWRVLGRKAAPVLRAG